MSEEVNETTVNEEQQAPADTAARGAGLRQGILVGLLVLMLAALGYDRFYARPKSEQAHATVESMISEQNRSATGGVTYDSDDVRKKLGREPSQIDEQKYHTVETYQWVGGIPTRSYSVYVIYKNSASRKQLRGTTLNEPPEDDVLPKGPLTQEEIDRLKAEALAAAAAAGEPDPAANERGEGPASVAPEDDPVLRETDPPAEDTDANENDANENDANENDAAEDKPDAASPSNEDKPDDDGSAVDDDDPQVPEDEPATEKAAE